MVELLRVMLRRGYESGEFAMTIRIAVRPSSKVVHNQSVFVQVGYFVSEMLFGIVSWNLSAGYNRTYETSLWVLESIEGLQIRAILGLRTRPGIEIRTELVDGKVQFHASSEISGMQVNMGEIQYLARISSSSVPLNLRASLGRMFGGRTTWVTLSVCFLLATQSKILTPWLSKVRSVSMIAAPCGNRRSKYGLTPGTASTGKGLSHNSDI